jgi:hypothetical protein
MDRPIECELQGAAVEGSERGVCSVFKLCNGREADSRYGLFGRHLSCSDLAAPGRASTAAAQNTLIVHGGIRIKISGLLPRNYI